jgi:glutathione-specific gamma-glutamylcyclotransferase
MRVRQMALTPDLVARVHRTLEDPGPEPHLAYHSEEEYGRIVESMLAAHPPGQDAWLFAYGSLIWKPEVEHVGSRRGTAHGWHRSFCFRITRFRATKDRPGLMMAVDRGGQCRGVLYRLPAETLQAQMGRLFRREFTAKPPNSMPRWIKVSTQEGPVTALAFVMNRRSPAYVGRLSPEEVAAVLSGACGHWGSGAEYLHNTVMHLEEHGIHDSNLWRLQKLVAERISESCAESAA